MADTDKHKEDLVNSFCNVTGVDKTRARLYLESAGWNLDLSLSSFYEESDEIEQDMPALVEDPVETSEPMQAPPQETNKIPNPKNTSSNRVTTFSSLVKDDSSDEETHQAFYAGGSERSGQQVLGPGKKKGVKDIISDMFKSAKEHGAEVLDNPSSSSGRPGGSSQLFRGAGYKLGSTETDSEVVGTAAAAAAAKPATGPIDMILRLWKNGFSVDGGPLRDFQDPANKDFLDSITRGEIPRELVRQSQGAEVSLNMEDHRHEDFKQAKTKVSAFAGEGHRLGSPSPLVSGENLLNSASSGDPKENEAKAQQSLNLNESESTTNIQIRLADGTRVIARVNHTHLIGDIRSFINLSRPQFASSEYVLMTTFPNKELTEDQMSVKDADLLNAVIVQRLK